MTQAGLITLDVHPGPAVTRSLDAAIESLAELGVRATFLVTGSVAQEYPASLRTLIAHGHQVGCHGLYHNAEAWQGLPPERYDRLGERDQRRCLETATGVIEQAIGRKVTVFRAPCFRVSGLTLRLLEELGYQADVSVNAQRLDWLGADPFGLSDLLAPRRPYHPSAENAYRRGRLTIWEIPLSCLIVPLAIMTAASLGGVMMRALTRVLHWESQRTRKPLVYMAHPEEFSADATETAGLSIQDLRPRDFLPGGHDGIRARRAFRTHDPAKLYALNRDAVETLTSFQDVQCVTVEEYVEDWLEA